MSPEVWSNSTAVYVHITADCNVLADTVCNWDPAAGGAGAASLYKNDGSGWRRIFRSARGGGRLLTGYPDGRIILSGTATCPVLSVREDGSATCLGTGSETWDASTAGTTANGDLFVVAWDGGGYVLLRYDGSVWTKLRSLRGLAQLINGFVVETDDATDTLWISEPGQVEVTQVSGLPLGAGAGGIWAYGARDILAGNSSGGLAHYDGTQWAGFDTGSTGSIDRMWGASDGTIYMVAQGGPTQWLGSWNANVASQIFAGATPVLSDLWGNSSAEVFLAVSDYALKKYTCGSVFLLWFDGTTFHVF